MALQITIRDLFIIIQDSKTPYPRIFTSKEEAAKMAKDLHLRDTTVYPCFINDSN
jgi:hypothetical protein